MMRLVSTLLREKQKASLEILTVHTAYTTFLHIALMGVVVGPSSRVTRQIRRPMPMRRRRGSVSQLHAHRYDHKVERGSEHTATGPANALYRTATGRSIAIVLRMPCDCVLCFTIWRRWCSACIGVSGRGEEPLQTPIATLTLYSTARHASLFTAAGSCGPQAANPRFASASHAARFQEDDSAPCDLRCPRIVWQG